MVKSNNWNSSNINNWQTGWSISAVGSKSGVLKSSFNISRKKITTGNASAPTLTFYDDTNTGLFSPTSDALAISTGGTERMRVDNSDITLTAYPNSRDDGATVVNLLHTSGTGKLQSAPLTPTGSFVPTINLSGSGSVIDAGSWRWQRIGNSVTVWGRFQADCGTASTVTIDLTLPVTSNFIGASDAAGIVTGFVNSGSTGSPVPSTPLSGFLEADATNNKIVATCQCDTGSGTEIYSFNFNYVVR